MVGESGRRGVGALGRRFRGRADPGAARPTGASSRWGGRASRRRRVRSGWRDAVPAGDSAPGGTGAVDADDAGQGIMAATMRRTRTRDAPRASRAVAGLVLACYA